MTSSVTVRAPGQDQPPPRRRRAAGGRLPPAGHRLPGRRALRRRHRRALAGLDPRASPCPDWIDPDAVPVTGDNIVDRAARLLADHHGIEPRGRGLDHQVDPGRRRHGRRLRRRGRRAGRARPALGRCETSDDDLLALAAELGSDVPFALLGGTALGTGRGELVEPVRRPGDLVVGRRAVGARGCRRRRSTGASTSSTPTRPSEPEGADAPSCSRSRPATPRSWPGALHNDLEAAALDLRPDLADLLELGERSGALRGLVSGSGPTCVFLTEDADAARGVAGRAVGATTTSSWSPTARSPARTWSPMPSPARQPAQPRAGLQVLRRPAAAHRRLARRRRRRADRRGRPQRRRQDHAARRDDRARGARHRPGLPPARAC